MTVQDLLAAATPRPWVAYQAERKIGDRQVWSCGRGGVSALDNNEADAKLAALAVNEYEALLDVLAAAREMQRTSGGCGEGDAWLRLSAALRRLDGDVV